MNKINVLLVDDEAMVRQVFRLWLNQEEDMNVVGEAENGTQAVALAKQVAPDVVLMDIAMPLLNGLEATRQIVKCLPTCKVLLVTAHEDDEFADQSLEAGAAGYLIKQAPAADLPKAIRAVVRGDAFFSPSVGKRLRERWGRSPETPG